jgi:hypothetical protein
VKPRTHLFVAAETAFGEAVLGMRIAHELHARGDRVAVLAGERLGVLTEGTPFQSVLVPTGAHKSFDRLVAKTATDVRADSIVLLDATLVYWLLKNQGSDSTFLRGLPAPVIGLDVWNVRETGLTWDLCGTTWQHSRHSLDVTRRLVPVPFAKTSGVSGLYDALPQPFHLDDEDRDDVRADLGAGQNDRLVLLTSALWQHAGQPHETGRRMAAHLPALAGELIGRLGRRVRVVHVGPGPYPMPSLGDRYTWLAPRTPARFARLLSSVDLLLSFNFSATTISSAIAAGLRVLLGVNAYAGTLEEVAARLPSPPSAFLRGWLDRAAPMSPFRVWPLGLHAYLAPLAKGNPYAMTLRTEEVLHEDAFVEALHALLFDEAAREELGARQAAYRREVASLPKAADLVTGYLES